MKLKFNVLFVLSATIFGFPSGTEALACKCTSIHSSSILNLKILLAYILGYNDIQAADPNSEDSFFEFLDGIESLACVCKGGNPSVSNSKIPADADISVFFNGFGSVTCDCKGSSPFSFIFRFLNGIDSLTCECKGGSTSIANFKTPAHILKSLNSIESFACKCTKDKQTQGTMVQGCNEGLATNDKTIDETCRKKDVQLQCYCIGPKPTDLPGSGTLDISSTGNGIVLRSWSWLPLSIFACSAIIVPTFFVGGQ